MKLTASKMIKGYAKLKAGMLKADVIELFGLPTGTRVTGDTETLSWKHSEFKGILRGGTIVRIIIADFKNGILTGYDSENMDRSKW